MLGGALVPGKPVANMYFTMYVNISRVLHSSPSYRRCLGTVTSPLFRPTALPMISRLYGRYKPYFFR
jgi:hypothetical protein